MEFISDITITQKAYSIISINIIPPTLLNVFQEFKISVPFERMF